MERGSRFLNDATKMLPKSTKMIFISCARTDVCCIILCVS